MKFKKIILISLLLTSIILTSCTGVRELDELGIVVTTAIDLVDEKVVLTHEVVVPKSNLAAANSDQPSIRYVQSSGYTVLDALRNATLEFDRKLFLAHNRVIILGEELAKKGVGQIINFYISDNEPRESAVITVAKGSLAYEVMGINGGLGESPGMYLSDLLKSYRVNMKTRRFTLNEFIRYYLDAGNTVLPIIQQIKKLEVDRAEDKSTKDALDIEGGAVLKKDKLIGYYNGDEMKGFNFIVDEFENGLIIFTTSDELIKDSSFRGERGEYTVIETKVSKTRNEIELIDGKLHLVINVNIKGTLIEDTKGINMSNQDILNAIKKSCSKKVEEYIRSTMDKTQKEFKIDTFSIGNLVHIKYPDLWREISDDWDSIFSNLEYEVKVSTDLIRSGLINTPVNIKMNEERLKENK